MRRIGWIAGAAFLMFVFLLFTQRAVLFQEGNPLFMGWAVVRLEVSDLEIVKVSDKPPRYLSPVDVEVDPFIKMMEQQGWKFADQMGGGIVFEKKGETFIATKRKWTRRYNVITHPEGILPEN